MKKIIFLLIIFSTLSCEKGNDIFGYSLSFGDPTPLNNAVNVPIREGVVNFVSRRKDGLALYAKEYRIYLDTINPPKKILSQSEWSIFVNGNFSFLKPNTNYYWAYSLVLPSGEAISDIQQFTTIGFEGAWKLDSIADKRGTKYYAIDNYGELSDWSNWYDWKGVSNIYTTSKKLVTYKLNQDSTMHANNAITEINIAYQNAAIKQFNNTLADFIQTDYKYNYQNGSIVFNERFTNQTHTFVAVYLGYSESYDKTVLLMLKNDCMLYIYSKKQP